MGFSLGSRVLLSRGLAREGWLLLVFILAAFGIFDGTIMNMTGGNETVNQGPHRGPSSIQNSESDSGSWRKYLTLSSEIEVNQTPGRQAPPLPIESGTVPPANAVAFSHLLRYFEIENRETRFIGMGWLDIKSHLRVHIWYQSLAGINLNLWSERMMPTKLYLSGARAIRITYDSGLTYRY
ncbi:hypothetical protein Pint_21232 [Pistacia integerrima]|uniref:Uncharacterized protein n=1 Tax=Pistacia integerrima TaxID=434235 RepID=A0ACC0XAI9_9ROSI|nr:hypothetical protein Pint_21232 [Pistacia integerrima]